MKQYKFTHGLVLLVLIMLSSASIAGAYPQALQDQIALAKKVTPVVSLEQFNAAINDPAIWIIDVREPDEYAAEERRLSRQNQHGSENVPLLQIRCSLCFGY